MSTVLDQVGKLVSKLRAERDLELEFRLGKLDNGYFVSGITLDSFEDIVQDLEGCSEFTSTETWKEEMDVFFTIGKNNLRTRVTYPSETMMVTPLTVQKNRIDCVNVKTSAPFDVRVALSSEKVCEPKSLPSIVEPNMVRLKHVKRFTLQRNNKDTWIFELSKTWTGSNRTEVEELQHDQIPIYEVECELLDTNDYIDKNSNKYVSESLIMKAMDLLGYPNAEYELYNKRRKN